ncbi:lysozyme [Nesidiocoris tenuis]|uniref:Lysozyme n=1 Tax=Nesidiocoris tenuis TaxID=355587 RepID=A0ABN7A9U1_9HEMI|nr:lysozyme [Nesidiocoris tenuis]
MIPPHENMLPTSRKFFPVIGTLLMFMALVYGRIYTPQGLAKDLREQRVSEWEIPTLVCVAHNASSLNTNNTSSLKMRNMRQTLFYYGIFGIPEEWMSKCEVTQEQLLDDDIRDDVSCLNIYLATNDRKSAIHMLTTGEVDLDKCLDWWDQMPLTLEAHHNTSQVKVNLDVTGVTRALSDYLLTASVLLLDGVLIVIAYFLYNLTKRPIFSDNISSFPLV